MITEWRITIIDLHTHVSRAKKALDKIVYLIEYHIPNGEKNKSNHQRDKLLPLR